MACPELEKGTVIRVRIHYLYLFVCVSVMITNYLLFAFWLRGPICCWSVRLRGTLAVNLFHSFVTDFSVCPGRLAQLQDTRSTCLLDLALSRSKSREGKTIRTPPVNNLDCFKYAEWTKKLQRNLSWLDVSCLLFVLAATWPSALLYIVLVAS